MRRIYTTLFGVAAAFALTATTAPAQTIGFKIGASIASQQYDPDADRSSLTGFAGGGLIRFGSGRLGIQLELLSVTKGSKSDGAAETKLQLEYVEIPLLVHLPLTTGASFAPYLIAGPSIGIEVSCSFEPASGSEQDCDDVQAGREKKTDFGITGGLGVAFAAGPGAVLLEGRYVYGLSNVASGTGAPEVKNRAILLMAGYEIPLGRR